MDAILRLPNDRQELLVLEYVEQLPNAEIGQIMGRSEGAIKALYHRTLLSLRDDLDTQSAKSPKGRSKKTRRWRFGRKQKLALPTQAQGDWENGQTKPVSATNDIK